eukprot:scaffold384082_cov23-Prasinocladus_malaysianus.AAC.1
MCPEVDDNEDDCDESSCHDPQFTPVTALVFDDMVPMVYEDNISYKKGETPLLLGLAYERKHDIARRVHVNYSGLPLKSSDTLSAEIATMPFMFPSGTGQFKGKGSLSSYISTRFNA